MIPYLAVLTAVAFATLLSLVSPRRYRWRLVVAPATLALCFMGFRERISADWDQYLSIFSEYSFNSFQHARAFWSIELGYGVLNYVVGRLTGNFHVLLFVCAGIMIWGILVLARDFELDPTLTLFLSMPYLIFAVGMGYERQSAAIGLTHAALGSLKVGKTRVFFIYAVLATLFHYSAGPFLLVFWVDSWLKGILVAACAGVSVFLSALGDEGEKLSGYATGTLAASGVWFRLGILALAMGIIWLQRDKWRTKPVVYGYFKRSAVILLVFFLLAQKQSVIVDRFSLYFFFLYLIALASAIEFSTPSRRWLVFGLTVAQAYFIMILWFQVSFFARNFWIPYTISFY